MWYISTTAEVSMSRVSDLVDKRELFTVQEDDSVAQVARRMSELHVGAILVLKGTELRGVFSERDLMCRVVLERLDPETTPVRAVMSTELETVDSSDTVEAAMQAMLEKKCRHLPVLKDGRVTAFISMRDLMSYQLDLKTEELSHIRAYIQNV
jgi:signal-transduction protein with cAMP-binding, CBS, and nucleotidyltransferase domain